MSRGERVIRSLVRRLPFQGIRHRGFVAAKATGLKGTDTARSPRRVLVIGVYLGGRANTVSHLVDRFSSCARVSVVQRWAVIGTPSEDPRVTAVTRVHETQVVSKFRLLNRLVEDLNLAQFDFVVVSDDDIYVQHDFLTSLLDLQTSFGFAAAQPARTWSSHSDHLFVTRRPWLRARQTLFVECGPLVSLTREAAALLVPFDEDVPLWGVDWVWPHRLSQHGLALGIIDAVPVEHSIRPQGSTYDPRLQQERMLAWLAGREHMDPVRAKTVLRRYW